MLRRIAMAALGFASIFQGASAQTLAPPATDAAADPFLWLEDVSGPRAMDWVRAENARALGVLEADPRFAALNADALKIAEARDRIPMPAFLDGAIYNYWQDSDHVRGLWRRTTLADYRSAQPNWTPVLDLDAVAKAESANWVFTGADCAWPNERRCLISLSDGGEDAVTAREFDLRDGRFVEGGFVLPRGKQDLAWDGENNVLVAREWAPGELTASGYPFIVKRVTRGQPLSAAKEVFRGEASDVRVTPTSYHDGEGHRLDIIVRNLSIFEADYWIVEADTVRQVALPRKVDIKDLVAGRLIVTLAQDWSVDGKTLPQGALVSLDVAALRADPTHLRPELVRVPSPRESIDSAGSTRSRLIVTAYENVKGRAFVYSPRAGGGWSAQRIGLPDNASISLVAGDPHGETAFVNATGFLDPSTLWQVNAPAGAVEKVKSLPAKFDATKDVVEQFEAVSRDGTRVPYFVVHPKEMKLDGANPTILNAYGGFQVSETPTYLAINGKLWLERGGVYVLANIRGGGEFGPAWHEAGLKTHRQRIYDDFAAVARDLITRGITSPRRLGIRGGSNGGLLMGVEFTQHPELWRAVDIQVPLLDMLRYEQIAAGASWVGEYGSVANPDERAFLASISPYNNLKAGVDYPEPLIWTTTKDDRVGPQHARKFAARLKALGKPYLFYEVIEGGHGAGANLKESAHTSALEMTYFIRKLMD